MKGAFVEEMRKESDRAIRSLAIAELKIETGFWSAHQPSEDAIQKRIAEIDKGAFVVRGEF